MRRLYALLLFLSCTVCSFAQNAAGLYTLKGKVTDTSGEAIIGANIKIKDTTTGTITDLDGNFSLLVSGKGAELVISFIGYKSENIKLKEGQNNLLVKLKDDAQNLDEVVVIGYGTQKKSSLTSSVEMVRSEDLLRMPTINIDEALNGQVAGLQVMGSTGDPSSSKESSIRIRGISGSSEMTPLLVIDGIPRTGFNATNGEMRLSDLNPDDIESISVLKDGAAAAVYGVRAGNGVILVKTKRGSNDQKVKVNYRGQFNLQQATQLPKFLNSYDFAKLYNKAVEGTETEPYSDEALEMIRTKSNPNKYADENMLDYLDKFGYSTMHTLSVRGGNNAVQYYISGGYTNTKGLYSGVGRDRFNYSMKLDATLLKGLVLSLDLVGNRSENKNTSYSTIDAAYSRSPIQPLRYTDSSLASIDGSNPLISVYGLGGYIRNKVNMNKLTANLKYDFAWVKGLSAYIKASFDDSNTNKKTFDKPVTLYKYDENTGIIDVDEKTVYPSAKIKLNEYDFFTDSKLFEFGINYNRTFAKKHDVSGLLVMNYQRYDSKTTSATNEDLPGIYPEVIGSTNLGIVTGTESSLEYASLIGRATYSYDNRYFIEGSFRMDGTPRFHPDYRWGFFPTVSASWVISNEKFFQNWEQRVLSNVKLRASTGILGRDADIDAYSYMMRYIYSTKQGYQIGESLKPGIILATGTYPNPDLKWEKSMDYNLAADLGFWDNRFGISFEYYSKYRSNMLTEVEQYLYPPSTGTDGNLPYTNFSKLKISGWDLTFTHRNSIRKVKYDLSLNLARTKDKYLDYGDESTELPNLRRKGTRSSDKWVYEADGLFQSYEEIANHKLDQDGYGNTSLAPGDIKYVDKNDDHVLDKNDLIPIRTSSFPDMSMSLRLGIQYQGFFVNAMFQGVTGYQKEITESYTLNNSTLQRFQEYHLTETWSETNRDALYPRIKLANKNDNNRLNSTFWFRDCDFVRLKSLSIGYNLPTAALKKMKISSLSIALQGSNLFTWSTLKDMDPESFRGYPIQRSYGLTLNFGF